MVTRLLEAFSFKITLFSYAIEMPTTPHLPDDYLLTLQAPSPLGETTLYWDAEGLCAHHWWPSAGAARADSPKGIATQRVVMDWLAAYWQGEKQPCDRRWLHFAVGTAFEQRVWEELCKIPYGQTCTYSDVAHRLGKTSTAARAVGRAIGRNPIAVLVPCHRVIGSSGALTGFAWGVARKRALLALEGIGENQLSLFGS